jgi:hypothetical protein
MRVEVSKKIGGVRLLLRKPFLEPMNEGNMRRLAEEARRRGGEAKEDERFIDVTVPGDCLHIRVETCDGGPEAEHVFVIPFMTRGERAYFMVKGRGRGKIPICDEVWVAERLRLLDYLDGVWSDIWDLIVMEIDELRSIIPPE